MAAISAKIQTPQSYPLVWFLFSKGVKQEELLRMKVNGAKDPMPHRWLDGPDFDILCQVNMAINSKCLSKCQRYLPFKQYWWWGFNVTLEVFLIISMTNSKYI
ncbi:hypothetical protein EDC04DRAFT_2599995 [Pisolithus marmoratus]|nr:hypothetical protein EDC04DRAFT_2599995 [Pisolithus marmoratus]